MKNYFFFGLFCLTAAAGFSQSNAPVLGNQSKTKAADVVLTNVPPAPIPELKDFSKDPKAMDPKPDQKNTSSPQLIPVSKTEPQNGEIIKPK